MRAVNDVRIHDQPGDKKRHHKHPEQNVRHKLTPLPDCNRSLRRHRPIIITSTAPLFIQLDLPRVRDVLEQLCHVQRHVRRVQQQHDYPPDSREPVRVRYPDQKHRREVMQQHLPLIFPVVL